MLIYNTLTKQKEPLVPIESGKVGLYVCGITVYDYCHMGHARIFIVFDTVVRYLRAIGYEVTYVRNITDIDDKIIHRAQVLNEEITTLTQRFIAAMHEDEEVLGVLPPSLEPRASEHIEAMIKMIDTLLAKGYAYIAESGDVCYEISKFQNYGELAHQDLNNLRAGARVEVASGKRDPLDFVLWKQTKPGEPFWPSPWGNGRPGWHLECSVMSCLHLSEHFDLHGGGCDLIFPHHENEIAQSEATFGHPVVKAWMHVGFLEINKEKMSKSKGNFFTLRQVLKEYNPEVIRYFMSASHYRSPLNYSRENLNSAKAALTRIYTALQDLPPISAVDLETVIKDYAQLKTDPFGQRFYAAMDDDFNTPEALSVLFDIAREINRLRGAGDKGKVLQLAKVLKALGSLLGIAQNDPMDFLRSGISLDNNIIDDLIKERNEARKNKDWAYADEVRDRLLGMDIELEDTAQGTVWKKKN